MKPLFLMDGITVQHAGELLFDTSASVRQRGQCADTYLRSLEDVTFALVLGLGLAVTRNLPKVGTETPGADLCSHFGDYVHPVEGARTAGPDTIIVEPQGRNAVAQWLGGLAHLTNKDYPFWREYALREADAYLQPADDVGRAVLLRPDAERVELKFGKDYWVVPELQRVVPPELTARLRDEILQYHALPPQNGLEFVERSIVAHTITFEWYQRQLVHGTGPGMGLTYLPHVTRTTFVAEEEIDRQLWHLGRLMMPRVLGEILKKCECRADVVKHIEDRIADSRLEPLRIRLRDAVEAQDSTEIKKIRHDIERQLNPQDERSPVDVTVRLGMNLLGPHAGAEAGTRLGHRRSRCDEAIRLALIRTVPTPCELRPQAIRVFPELADPRI